MRDPRKDELDNPTLYEITRQLERWQRHYENWANSASAQESPELKARMKAREDAVFAAYRALCEFWHPNKEADRA